MASQTSQIFMHGVEGIELFVIFFKGKIKLYAKTKYMGGCICSHSYVCFMSKRFPEALSEEESSKNYEMQSQRLRNTRLSGVFVYLNPGRKKDAMTKRQPSRMTLSSTCQLLNYFHTDNEKENKPCVVKLFK